MVSDDIGYSATTIGKKKFCRTCGIGFSMVGIRTAPAPVWCLRNNYTFVALKLAWGEARGRECIPSDTRPTEQRSPRPISAQPGGRHVFWADASLLAPHRSTSGYALVPVRKHHAPSLLPKCIAAKV